MIPSSEFQMDKVLVNKDVKPPRGERGWSSSYDGKGNLMYMITSKLNNRDNYYIYKYDEGKLVKLGRAKSPPECVAKFWKEGDKSEP